MVVLFFDDGHAERHEDSVLDTMFAQTGQKQVVTLLTPEEIEMAELDGVLPWQQEAASPFTPSAPAPLDWVALLHDFLEDVR